MSVTTAADWTPLAAQVCGPDGSHWVGPARLVQLFRPRAWTSLKHTFRAKIELESGTTMHIHLGSSDLEDEEDDASEDDAREHALPGGGRTRYAWLGGLDPTLRYYFYCEQPVQLPRSRGGARSAPVLLALLAEAPTADDEERFCQQYRLATGRTCPGKVAREALTAFSVSDSGVCQNAAWRAVDKELPYYRLLKFRPLFRLWPQATLMALSWETLQKLSELLEAGDYVKLMFRWCIPDISVWDAMQLTPLAPEDVFNHLALTEQWPLTDKDRKRQLATAILLQRGLQPQNNGQHTYLTRQQIVRGYYRGQQTSHSRVGVHTLLGENLPEHALMRLLELFESQMETDGVIMRTQEEGKDVIYARNQWENQQRAAELLNEMVQRFNRELDADGCATQADVEEKMRRAEPPAPSPLTEQAAPRWPHPKAQRLWAMADPEQRKAVANALLQPLSIINGWPGCGKTQALEMIYALLGGEAHHTIAVAAYGRIAVLLEQRLGGGFTFHKLTALLEQPKLPVHMQLREARTLLVDEKSLVTTNHLCLLLARLPCLVRLVLVGDDGQLPAIGAGGISASFGARYGACPAVTTTLRYPHRFLRGGTDPAAARQRPADLGDPLVTVWNMRQVNERQRGERFDPVYGRSYQDYERGARFTLLEAASTDPFLDYVAQKYFAEERAISQLASLEERAKRAKQLPHEPPFQFMTHRNAVRTRINHYMHAKIYGKGGSSGRIPLQPGEFLMFLKNAYFTESGQVLGQMERLLQAGDLVFTAPLSAPAAPPANDAEDLEARPDDQTWLDISNNVANGEIRRLGAIADVDVERQPGPKGKRVVARIVPESVVLQRTVDAPQAVGTKVRLLLFTDGKQLNLTKDYALNRLEAAYASTVPKLQGSEFQRGAYVDEPDHQEHVTRELVQTAQTRPREQFCWVGSTPQRLQRACDNPSPPRQNRFAYYLKFDPQ